MATTNPTDYIKRVAGEFCRARNLDIDAFAIHVSEGGNIVMRSDFAEYVLSMSGVLVHFQIRERPESPTPYLAEGDVIPTEVVRAVRADAANLGVLDEWKRSLVSGISISQTVSGKRIQVRLVPQGGKRAMVSFADFTLGRPYPIRDAKRILSREDEIRYLEERIRNAPYELTEVGKEQILDACHDAARSLYKAIAPSQETMRVNHNRYDGIGRLVLDGLGSKCPELANTRLSTSVWRGLSSNGSSFLDPWNICCEIGSVHAFYDLCTKRVRFDDEEIRRARLYVRTLAYDASYNEIEAAVRERFPISVLNFGITGDTDFDIDVGDITHVRHAVKMESYSPKDLDGILDAIEEQVIEGRRQALGPWGDHRALVGALMPMAIMQFLLDNQRSPVRDRITRGVVIKAMKGHPLDTFVGMVRRPLFDRMGAYDEDDIRQAFEALRHNRLISYHKRLWKDRLYDIAFPIRDTTMEFMVRGHADAEEGTPADGMTEWQLLGLLDGDVASRPFEQLATELPALIDHPACYFAEPEKFVAYVRALPDTLQDYIRISRDMADDGMPRMMLDALVREIGEGLSGDDDIDLDDGDE